MTLCIPKKIIAFTSLLIFVFAIYGAAFGAIGCHSSGEGFQSVECTQAHTPETTPHIYSETDNQCVCDQLACHSLKSRTRVKRHMPQLAVVDKSSVFEIVLPSSAIISGRYDSSFLYLVSQSLVFLRTVVLLH